MVRKKINTAKIAPVSIERTAHIINLSIPFMITTPLFLYKHHHFLIFNISPGHGRREKIYMVWGNDH